MDSGKDAAVWNAYCSSIEVRFQY